MSIAQLKQVSDFSDWFRTFETGFRLTYDTENNKVTGFGLVDERFQTFLKRCNCAIQLIMTQIDKFSIVQERTDLIRLLLFSRNKRKGKTILRWQAGSRSTGKQIFASPLTVCA